MGETPWEVPAEDAAEQHAEVEPEAARVVVPHRERADTDPVDPADAAEQETEVPVDDEERR